jgi:outer membrane protein TolC
MKNTCKNKPEARNCRALRLEIDRYKVGTASYLDVINSQTIAVNNQRSAVALLQRKMVAATQLIAAVGRGWDTTNLPMP